ncbi:MAG: hypothetical protein JWP81_1950 [Ferruginibacter sp.]|nr:hypothetical protein [Ferruginibacter sp.]
MKKILILYSHFPPSNLAGVHRARLFAQHLPAFFWEPIVLTVHEKYYEEELDWKLVKLLPKGLRVVKVKAMPLTKPRLLGDIGLRAFFQMYKRAKELINEEQIDFLYIPIPSFYTALLGRLLHSSTQIRYGIDYIDPWVHDFPGSDRLFSRHWFSTQLAKLLEPIAVAKAVLITGVSESYYIDVLKRNPKLASQIISGAMPYGAEPSDHKNLVPDLKKPRLFRENPAKVQLVYAGALLPKAYELLEALFKSICRNENVFSGVEFHFIGTGKNSKSVEGFALKQLAEKYGIWQSVIFEYPNRLSYLDVLIHLSMADAIFILGSTESHYTPSKTFQAVLSGKMILSVLHEQSTAVNIIRQSRAGLVMDFNGLAGAKKIEENFPEFFTEFLKELKHFDTEMVDKKYFEQYSAENMTRQLAILLNKAMYKTSIDGSVIKS